MSYVIARDPKRRIILLGGLGVLGVGQMWFQETEYHKTMQDYNEAKIVDTRDEPLFGIVPHAK